MALEELLIELKELNRKVSQIVEMLQASSFPSPVNEIPSGFTLHKWLDEWYKEYKAPNVKPNTLGTINVSIRVHIKPNLPDVPLNNITGLTLQKFFANIEKSRTRKTVFDVLNSSLKDALNLKLIKENPMSAVKIPKHVRVRGSCLDSQELKKFLKDIRGHKLENYFLFLLYTGCRRNEGLNLKRSDVDFKNKLLHIPGTKTESSDRTIPLIDKAAGLLVKITPQKDGVYFPFRPDYVTRKFKKFCPSHKLHDLRHTFATRCLQAKISMKVVQTWLGHTEIDTTANIYSHVTKELNTSEAKVLNKYLENKQ